MIKRLIIILILCFPALGLGANYYVAQNSAGNADGTSYEDRANMTYHNNGSGVFADLDNDTVNICGTITSPRIEPPDGGTLGNEVNYSGTCSEGSPALIQYPSSSGSAFNTSGADYLIIDGFEMDGNNGSTGFGFIVTGSHHVLITNNEIYEMATKGIAVQSGSYAVTIGGSSGNGNEIYNCGQSTAGTDISLYSGTRDVTISYNKLYGTLTTFGVDGVATHNSHDILIEYNVIYNHTDSSDGEDGIDLKENSYNVVMRYNHIYGHNGQSGITSQLGSYSNFIYGNSIHDNRWAGVYIKRGAYELGTSDHAVEDIYVFGNISYQNASGAMIASSGDTMAMRDIQIFNNTFAENGNKSTIQGAGVMVQYGTGHIVKNNVFYKNTDDTNDNAPYQQIQKESGPTVTYDNNIYWYDSTTGRDLFTVGSTEYNITEWKALGGSYDPNSTEENPDLEDIDNNNYEIANVGSGVYGAGEDMGSGSIATVTVTGSDNVDNVIAIPWDFALGPDTVFHATDPDSIVIDSISRDSLSNWSVGAYEFDDAADTTAPTLSSATIDETGLALTLVYTEAGSHVLQGSAYSDSHLNLDCSVAGDDIALTYVSGNASNTHVYSIGSIVIAGETCNFDFDGTANSLEDVAGNDLAAIVSDSVTNNSTFTWTISAPMPADDSTDVAISVDLSFTRPANDDNVDVYIETKSGACDLQVGDRIKDDADITSVSNADILTHLGLTVGLVYSTTYCWRVDENYYTTETKVGSVLEFTTTDGPPPPAGPADGFDYNIDGKNVRHSSEGVPVVF